MKKEKDFYSADEIERILLEGQGVKNKNDLNTPLTNQDYWNDIDDFNDSKTKYSHIDKIFDSYSADKAKEIADAEPPSRKLCGSLVYEGEQTFLFGFKNTGKSTLGFMMANAIAKGENLNLGEGIVLINETEAQPVVYLELELSKRQFSLYIGSRGHKNLHRVYLKRGESLPDDPKKAFEYVRDLMKKHNSKVIFIDNLSKMTNIDLEKAKEAREFMRPLLDLCKHDGYSTVIISHPVKGMKAGTELEKDDMRGSGTLTDLADSIIGLGRMPKIEGDKSSRAYIIHLNTRNEMEYDENNVIKIKTIKEDGLKHEALGTCTQNEAIHGSGVPEAFINATRLIKEHGSSRKAEAATIKSGNRIPHTTLANRSKQLEAQFPEVYEKVMNDEFKEI